MTWSELAELVPYKPCVIGLIAAIYLFHVSLDVRQLRALKIPTPPTRMEKYREKLQKEEYEKTQLYNLDKWYFNLAHSISSVTIDVTVLAFDWLPWLWAVSSRAVSEYGLQSGLEIQTSVVFFALVAGAQLILDLPWSLWSTFRIEQMHGFNQTTLKTYFMDLVKTVMLFLLLAPPVLSGFVYILMQSGPWMVAYLWAFVAALTLIGILIFPTFIQPLFNKFTALPDGTLRQRIEELAQSLNFPLKALYVIDGSKRSAHSNAYFFGFGKNRRIVLYDTLLEQCSEEQIVAVLAHELGHWKLGHVMRNLIMMQVVLLLQFTLFAASQHNHKLMADFGFVAHRPALISFLLFTYILSPVDEVLGLLSHVVSRRFEYQADAFAVTLGKGEDLKAGLIALEAKNRSASHVDPLYSAFHYSHPPVPERLAAIDEEVKKSK